ncbi:hypothetical protein CHS0354_003077 [Potamilus streckersoni]|uniref:Uncharacterized protein n=1 Tax=Potamilus streckersoni TaxID=2493646 RepID=A0AAE0RP50_9BIVA|nr:hypothetical protein CHS0354_003077 [Potamilus streckersoni]
MAMLIEWTFFLCLLKSTITKGDNLSENTKDIMDATAGETFLIRTWFINGTTLLITVKKDNMTRLNAHVDGYADNIARDENDRLDLKYNQSVKREAVLLFHNVSKEDEGLYQMEESFYTPEIDLYNRNDGIWSLQLNVFRQQEVMRHCVGENITMRFSMLSEESRLYLYNQLVAVLDGPRCIVFTASPFYGRLRCTSDVFNEKIWLIIVSIAYIDAGLYKRITNGSESGRWFLSITDYPTSAFIGDNVTISWYYNQQGMNRTLRIIHPNEGVMMILQPSNNSTIKSNFKHRVLYSGDISRSYMSFTLMNISKSDTGVYTIETPHGNIIPDIATTSNTSTATLDTDSTVIPEYSSISIRNGPQSTIRANTESITEPDVQISSTRNLRPSDEEKDTEIQRLKAEIKMLEEEKRKLKTERGTEECGSNLPVMEKENEKIKVNIPAIVFPVIFGVACMIILMIVCLIRIQRMDISNLEAERRHLHVESDTDLCHTNIAAETSDNTSREIILMDG